MTRPFVLLSCVLVLAALNVGVRLNREIVTEWDESLYATTAAEALESGHWVATTFHGEVDYYNTKPPLNIWLIASSFKVFGISLASLRLPSALATWASVLTLCLWGRRLVGSSTALLAGLVLSTTYAFLYVHSGRSGNPDALFSLLVLLTVVVLELSRSKPWRLAWLGPLMAASFLLKGMGVLMPAAIAGLSLIWDRRRGPSRAVVPLVGATGLAALPIVAWAWARWNFDGSRFFALLFGHDFVDRVDVPLEGHAGGLLYYIDVLQKDHFDWIAVAILAWLLAWPAVYAPLNRKRDGRTGWLPVFGPWVLVTLVVPTMMNTKLAWYLNPFYPAFALAVASMVTQAYRRCASLPGWRQAAIVTLVVVGVATAEGRLIWYSVTNRTVDRSAQGLLIVDREALAGGRVYQDHWDNADAFVLRHIARADGRTSASPDEFLRVSAPGDCLVSQLSARVPLRRANARWGLYCRPR